MRPEGYDKLERLNPLMNRAAAVEHERLGRKVRYVILALVAAAGALVLFLVAAVLKG